MYTKALTLLTTILLITMLSQVDRQKIAVGQDILDPMSSMRLTPPSGEAWKHLNQPRWFWYAPNEWSLPTSSMPPVIMSMDATGPWYEPESFRQFPMTTGPDAGNTTAPTRFTSPVRGVPQAYRWNEATGQAEPLEIKRWGAGSSQSKSD